MWRHWQSVVRWWPLWPQRTSGARWLRQTAIAQLGQAQGRQVTLEACRVQAPAIACGPGWPDHLMPMAASLLLQVAQARVQLSLASLRHLAPVVESVSVTAPWVLARLAPQRWNYNDIVARMARAACQTL